MINLIDQIFHDYTFLGQIYIQQGSEQSYPEQEKNQNRTRTELEQNQNRTRTEHGTEQKQNRTRTEQEQNKNQNSKIIYASRINIKLITIIETIIDSIFN